MNMAAFAVIAARERETDTGDDISSLYGLGADRPALAWPMTIAMLSLAGFPATAGFFGKLYLIEAAVDNEYAWLGVAIVLGSAISLVYYLRVDRGGLDAARLRRRARSGSARAAPRPAIAGGSPEADEPEDGRRGAARAARTAAERRAGRRQPRSVVTQVRRRRGVSRPLPPRPRRGRRSPRSIVRRACCARLRQRSRVGIYPDPLLRRSPATRAAAIAVRSV